MDQGQPAVGGLSRCRDQRRYAGAQGQAGDQVEDAALSPGRIGEDLLFQPIDACEVEAVGSVGEEHLEEFGEERFQQHFEPLIVVNHGSLLCRRIRPVFRPQCTGAEDRSWLSACVHSGFGGQRRRPRNSLPHPAGLAPAAVGWASPLVRRSAGRACAIPAELVPGLRVCEKIRLGDRKFQIADS
jgi:hypothetical protein